MEWYFVALAVIILVPGIVSMMFPGRVWDLRTDKRRARTSIHARRREDRAPAPIR